MVTLRFQALMGVRQSLILTSKSGIVQMALLERAITWQRSVGFGNATCILRIQHASR